MAADIRTRLILDNRQFNTALDISKRLLSGFASAIKGAVVTVTALAATVSALTLRQTSLITKLQETASLIGVNTEFLQKFRYAAGQSGIAVETADKALRDFTKRLSEAARGGGEAFASFRELGIQLTNSNGAYRSTEDVLNDVADALNKTSSESDRIRIATKLFGEEGVALVNTLAAGSDSLKMFYDDASKLGGVLTVSATAGVKRFSDELFRLQTLAEGVLNQVVAALAPALEELTRRIVNYLSELAESLGGWEALGRYLANELIDIIIRILKGFESVANIVIFVINKVAAFASVLGDIWNTIAGIIPGMERMEDIAARLRANSEEDLIKPIDLTDTIAGLREVQRTINEIEQQGVSIEITRGAGQERYNWIFRQLQKIFDPTLVGEFWYQFKTQGLLSIDTIKSGFEMIVGPTMFARFKEALENASIGFKGLGDTLTSGLVEGIKIFEDSLATAIQTGKLSFTDLGNHIRQVLAKALVQKFITGPILAAFGLPGLAAGGPAMGGQPYIVGEKGPELFVPRTSGTVIPNNQLGNGAAAATQVVYNINAVDAMSFKQMVARDPEFIYSVTQAGARRLPR